MNVSVDNCEDDDEVISATPQPVVQKFVIKERHKNKHRSGRSAPPEPAKHSNSVTPVKISPTIKSDAILPAFEIGNTFSIRKPTEGTSPLRRIENRISKSSESPKWLSKTPIKKANVFYKTGMEPKAIARTSTSPQRKHMNVSLTKPKNLKQATINFVPNDVKIENSSTFCNNLLADVSRYTSSLTYYVLMVLFCI